MNTPVTKTEVKRFTLNTFLKFCWTSSLIEDEFETIVAKFFDCAAAEMHDDGLMLSDEEFRPRWARQDEIDRFLDYVSSQYLTKSDVPVEVLSAAKINFNRFSKKQLVQILDCVQRKCDLFDKFSKDALDRSLVSSISDWERGRESGFRQASEFIRGVLILD
jgi:hypothetical protein